MDTGINYVLGDINYVVGDINYVAFFGGCERSPLATLEGSKLIRSQVICVVVFMMNALDPPVEGRDAVKNWQRIGRFTRMPSGEQYSFIDGWGVRAIYTEINQEKKAFLCLADSACRMRQRGRNLVLLSGGKTSSAVRHLKRWHHIESPKTAKEVQTKRKRNADIEHLRESTLYAQNPARLNRLLGALRLIHNNLPLKMVEYEESRLKEALVSKQEMQCTLNVERISEAIIKLYSSTRNEVAAVLASNLQQHPNLTMVADMWTCKTTGQKFLGIRFYVVDNDWKFRSVLLGTRKFAPAYGDRDGGIQAPFLCWIKRTLEDIGLAVVNVYGATSDKHPGVHNLMTNR
ncbi:unnamed protein product [Phytophthora fragariaefolia]|uniref:Unnamed protein product n=1 Tax=Phytophthora fragariaefolia TaxID=1490495 RepID=A0A9W6XC34_9STRA|nr:unnamed protein product [Phytophthora fragariaefolia]